MPRPLLLLFLCLFVPCCGRPVATNEAATLIQPLIDPAKLATLGDRGANSRIQKITAILWEAKAKGQDPAKPAGDALGLIGWGDTEKGRITVAAMVRNVTILERLGSTTPEDLDNMKHGKAATVRKGPYTGEVLSVDHIIPRAIAPELDNVIANLELMPLNVNRKKSAAIGDRQVSAAIFRCRDRSSFGIGYLAVVAKRRRLGIPWYRGKGLGDGIGWLNAHPFTTEMLYLSLPAITGKILNKCYV